MLMVKSDHGRETETQLPKINHVNDMCHHHLLLYSLTAETTFYVDPVTGTAAGEKGTFVLG